MRMIEELVIEKLGIRVEASIISVGRDWLIIISGGERPHIGAISFGSQEEEYDIAMKDHKEIEVTHRILQKLKPLTTDNLLISGGIHIDHITGEQIVQVMEMCDILAANIKKVINQKNPAETKENTLVS